MNPNLVEAYNPIWPLWFNNLKNHFAIHLHGIVRTIEHVGSTAVPEMTAKPIIDIDIVINRGEFISVKEQLLKIGYTHEGDLGIPGREAFKLTENDIKSKLPPHHLYVCERGNKALHEHIAFRDFLIRNPEWREKLSYLKRQLCVKYANDRQAYIDGKASMVVEITKLALKH